MYASFDPATTMEPTMETERPRSGEPDSDSAAASADPEAEIESGDAAV